MKKVTQTISGEYAQEVITGHMKRVGLTQKQLSGIMGESPQILSQQFRRTKDMKMRRFVEVMEYLGFEVVVCERGYRRVSPEYAKEIIETCNPHGLFWCKDGEVYVGIDSQRNEVFCEEFNSMVEMKKWFNGEACTNSEGFSLN